MKKGIRTRVTDNIYIGKNVNIKSGSLIKLGGDVVIRPDCDLWANGKGIIIGDGTEIGERSRVSIRNSLKIGKNVLFSPNVYITDCDHNYTDVNVPVINQDVVSKPNRIVIGDGSFVGINAVIVGNVTIGKHCVIGANSVVTKSIPDYSIAVGSPAKIIKQYNWETQEWKRV